MARPSGTSVVSSRSGYRVTFAVVSAATTGYAILQSLVLPVLPTIQASLHTSQSAVTWLLTAYLLAAAIATPIVGRLGDIVGKKRVLVAVLVLLAVGTLVAALASSISVMITARVVQGAGGAILPLSFGIIRDEFPHEKVAMAIGTIAALLAVGGGIGTVLAGPIVDALDYHFLFWLPLILIAALALVAHLYLPESDSRVPGRISVLPALLLTGCLVALLLAVSEGSQWGWVSDRLLCLFAATVVLIPLWIASEVHSAHPLIDMRMMRVPAVWTNNLVALLFGLGMYSIVAFLPEFLQTPRSAGYGFGASTTASGVYLLPMTALMFCFGLLSGRLADIWGSKQVLLAGSALTAASFVVLTVAHDRSWQIYLFSGLLGAGLGFSMAAMSNLLVVAVPPTQVGAAAGMNANIRTIGGSIGAAVVASIVTSGASASGLPTESGYNHGFLFMAISAALAAAACLAIPGAGRRANLHVGDAEEHVIHSAEVALVAAAPLVEEN
jgi:EmrB/QacA subfamily drug resistance transporter